jgi:hypothetical protein
MHAIACAGPHVPFCIDSQSIGAARRNLCENLSWAQPFTIGRYREDADVTFSANLVRNAGVRDIDQ